MQKVKQAIITREKWLNHFGSPCTHYYQGCAVCDGWELWSEITKERIEYPEGHDVDCECRACRVSRGSKQ